MNVNIYQIFYDDASRKALDKGFIPLDNSKNERPDWFEFWPMRQFLHETNLVEDSWYGFFSPRFALKTGFNARLIKDFVQSQPQTAEVALFTSTWDFVAYFQNAFEQGEVWHEGITDVTQKFYDLIDYKIDLHNLVNYSRNSVTSNYIVAKPRFWRRWLYFADKLFDLCENNQEFGQVLRAHTTYGPRQVPFKVFIQERLASVLLANEDFVTVLPDQSQTGAIFEALFFTDLRTRQLLQTCDVLKGQYCISGDMDYLQAYKKLKQLITIKPTKFR